MFRETETLFSLEIGSFPSWRVLKYPKISEGPILTEHQLSRICCLLILLDSRTHIGEWKIPSALNQQNHSPLTPKDFVTINICWLVEVHTAGDVCCFYQTSARLIKEE